MLRLFLIVGSIVFFGNPIYALALTLHGLPGFFEDSEAWLSWSKLMTTELATNIALFTMGVVLISYE